MHVSCRCGHGVTFVVGELAARHGLPGSMKLWRMLAPTELEELNVWWLKHRHPPRATALKAAGKPGKKGARPWCFVRSRLRVWKSKIAGNRPCMKPVTLSSLAILG
jgi:hypothetical protein